MAKGTSTMQELARRRLDHRLAEVDTTGLSAPPPSGWVRAIRDALGMSQRDLGARLGISGPSVASLEGSEQSGTIGLNTLRRAADALECDLVYVLVPRRPLDATVRQAALAKARITIRSVEHTMALEDQATDSLDRMVESTADQLVESGRVWH